MAAALFALLAVAGFGRQASAETLNEALVDAYLINPTLNAERARLRAIDEQVAVAKSDLRPNIFWNGDAAVVNTNIVGGSRQQVGQQAQTQVQPPVQPCDAAMQLAEPAFCAFLAAQQQQQQQQQKQQQKLQRQQQQQQIGGQSEGVTHPRGYTFTLSQPIFQGFGPLNSIRQAKALVQAGRESLRLVEQNILLNAATAYVDVVRDVATVRLRQNNVEVLTKQLAQTKDRFDVGEVTRTDVAQAEARRADALATLAIAQADLKTSNATYEQVIGHPPGTLTTPPSIRHLLPGTLADAMTLGDGENPLILSAVYSEEASLYNVQVLMADLLPTVTLDASYSDRFGESSGGGGGGGGIGDGGIGGGGIGGGGGTQTFTVMGTVIVPLYQGGGPSASVRQAKETVHQLKKQVEDARLSVHADVVTQWGVLQSTLSEIASAEASVAANKIALTGVEEEEKVGQRTTLDVLNAQLELVTAEIGLVVALRDRLVSEYSLYAAIGRMDAQTLGLPVPYYDPFEHYDRVKNKWFGLRPPPPPVPDE